MSQHPPKTYLKYDSQTSQKHSRTIEQIKHNLAFLDCICFYFLTSGRWNLHVFDLKIRLSVKFPPRGLILRSEIQAHKYKKTHEARRWLMNTFKVDGLTRALTRQLQNIYFLSFSQFPYIFPSLGGEAWGVFGGDFGGGVWDIFGRFLK